MKKYYLLFIVLVISLGSLGYEWGSGYQETGLTASNVGVEVTEFDGNLSVLDDTVQKALETIDEMTVGAGASDKITEGNTEAEVVDTGSDGHFKVTTEGVERLRVTKDGYVGIGTTAPSAKLEVTDTTYPNSLKYNPNTAVLSISGPVATLAQMPRMSYNFNGDPDAALSYLMYAHDNIAISFDSYHNGTTWMSSHALSNFALYKVANELVVGYSSGTAKGSNFGGFNLSNAVKFSNDGKLGIGGSAGSAKLYVNGDVGIGTTAPSAKLHSLATTEQLRLGYDSSNYVSTTVGSTGAVTLNAVGSGSSFNFADNVGIGTSAPTSKLHIVDTDTIIKAGYRVSGSYSGLNISGSILPTIFLDATDNDDNGYGPVLFLGNGGTPKWQFYMPNGSEGFGAYNRMNSKFGYYIDTNNRVAIGQPGTYTNTTVDAQLDVHIGNAAYIGQIIHGAASQSADYFQIKTSAGSGGDVLTVKSTGNVGIATTAPSAKLHAISTTEQLRLGYDTSNYVSTTVGSTGAVTLDAVGSGASFNFSDPINNITLPATSSSTSGVIFKGTDRLFHTTGTGNLFLGPLTGNFTATGIANIGVGYANFQNLTSGNYNVGFGYQALSAITTGLNNTAIGHGAIYSPTTLRESTAVGFQALFGATGWYNTGIGSQALKNASGYYNTALGHNSLNAVTTGTQNIGLGQASGSFITTGSYNVVIGQGAMYSTSTPNDVIAIGQDSARYYGESGTNTTSSLSNSVYLGTRTKTSADAVTNEIAIGYSTVGNGSNSVTLGNTSITKTVLRPNVGIGTTAPTAALEVNGGILPSKVTADPCGTGYPEGTLFYNDTSNYFCYCDGTNDVQMHDPSTACF